MVSEREQAMLDNPEALASLQRGIEDSREGRTHPLDWSKLIKNLGMTEEEFEAYVRSDDDV